MSESVSADIGVSPTGSSADAPAPVSPAPNTQPSISISDAARMLRSARPAAPTMGAEAAAPVEAPAAPAETPPEAPPRRASGVEAMERALGLKPAEGAQEAPQEASESAGGFEFDGRRLTDAEVRAQLNYAKDYTFKTQQLARQQQEVQQAQQMLAQFLPTIAPEIQRMQSQFQQTQPPDPALKHTNPEAYVNQMNAWYEAFAHNQRYEQMQQQMFQARDAAMQKAVNEGNQYLAGKYEFWGNPEQRNEVVQHMRSYATGIGYSEAELNNLTNPLYVETLLKAMAFDSQMKSMPRTEAPRPAVRAAPPRGAALPPRPVEAVAAASQAFAAKPSWQNGAALLTANQVADRSRGNGHSSW